MFNVVIKNIPVDFEYYTYVPMLIYIINGCFKL